MAGAVLRLNFCAKNPSERKAQNVSCKRKLQTDPRKIVLTK